MFLFSQMISYCWNLLSCTQEYQNTAHTLNHNHS